jgi:hypothetical protein
MPKVGLIGVVPGEFLEKEARLSLGVYTDEIQWLKAGSGPVCF